MIIQDKNNYVLNGFFRKSEIEFIGKEIDFKFMTPLQLNKEIANGIALYNELYPPKSSFMRKVASGVMLAGIVAVTGGAILASYGVGMGTALGTVFGAGSATAAAGSTVASIQTAASGISAAGLLYGKVTGDTPEDLIKTANLIKSENALEAMTKVAKEELRKKGVELQADDIASNDALRERLKQEQKLLSEKMLIAADKKAATLGQPTPEKAKLPLKDIALIATPFILSKIIG